MKEGHKEYTIQIDAHKYTIERPVSAPLITGAEILGLAGKTYLEWSLNGKEPGGRRTPIKMRDTIDLNNLPYERFESVRRQAQQG